LNSAAFAIALYRRLAASPGNFLFSPYSVATALCMAHAGARGRTREEIEAALGATRGELLDVFGGLARELRRLGDAKPHARFQLRTANSLWHQAGYPVDTGLVDSLSRELGAQVIAADFQERPREAVARLNAWVAEATEGRIPAIAGWLDPLTRVILANAVYFKAAWQWPFEAAATRPAPFRLLDGHSVEVPMMHHKRAFGYARSRGIQAVRLPYSNDWFALTILLPDTGRLEAAERKLDSSMLLDLVGLREGGRDLRLWLPRFRIESAVELRPHCEALGIVDAFGPRADFSGISSEPGFALSQVLHRARVDVDEEGTEAAAATATIMVGAALWAPKPREVRVDRPFLFVISDRPTGSILFMGRVVDPRRA
jgi:serpin B